MTLSIVTAPENTPVTTLARLATPDLDTTVMLCSPGAGGTTAGVSLEILRALGKDERAQGRARHDFDTVFLAPIWLLAHRVSHLIALSVQDWPPRALYDCAQLAAASGATLTLACDHGYTDRITDAVAAASPQHAAWPDATTPPSDAMAEGGGDWDPMSPERLPRSAFFTFRADCRRLLEPKRFAAVDARYLDTVTRVRKHHATRQPTEDGMRDLLAELLSECVTRDDVTVTMRAVQAALLPLGWLLKYDHDKLQQTLTRHRVAQLTTTEWQSLRAYSEPARPATVAMYLAGLSPEQMLSVTVGEVAHAYATRPAASLRGKTIAADAWPYMRAQLLVRATDAAEATDQFLSAPKKNGSRSPSVERRIRLDLRQAADDLGLNLGEGVHGYTETAQTRWSRRIGFVIEKVA